MCQRFDDFDFLIYFNKYLDFARLPGIHDLKKETQKTRLLLK